MDLRLVLALVGSYLLGAIPTAYWVVRAARGEDLRTMGSGNLGATNLYRQLGWRYAIPVGLFDALKGAIPVALIGPWAGLGVLGSVGLGLIAVVGHVYSVFVGFRGGKGVATGGGIVLGIAPLAFVAALVGWIVIVRLSGYVSLGSIVAAAVLPPLIWLLHPAARAAVWPMAGLSALVIWFHRTNIRRLLAGTENRFGRKAAVRGAP
ncbi:MAG: glycerol-3-phosphate 1-O-acyltransferase PlsY [Gemmatimonadetes bacterium]|nr:glycerol-3-phosphate 1-O-acyltransferase PlsY [Gemmatimonadota bacterium]MCA9767328.1 glycerol-3-phosphate 1-O-acyltransferase PlsY [Gemmatimonadota bacterium]MCB9518173.1 glycerol-3-phosphate 1-O-acyltransferase PlsY [Gemmatimonadales bacterium]HPF62629.1 glycerol-3-phosphate 1-O-acyltransferase PlsY [Gemmatimonadales bacterium]